MQIEGPFFHGKAYVGAYPSTKEIRRGVAVVGSSNFTYGGLVKNRELNMLNTDREAIEELVVGSTISGGIQSNLRKHSFHSSKITSQRGPH